MKYEGGTEKFREVTLLSAHTRSERYKNSSADTKSTLAFGPYYACLRNLLTEAEIPHTRWKFGEKMEALFRYAACGLGSHRAEHCGPSIVWADEDAGSIDRHRRDV